MHNPYKQIKYINLQNTTVQGISGTGSLCIGAYFLNKYFPGNKEIYLPAPTWGNHIPLFKMAGLGVKSYRYYDKNTCGLDFQGVLEDISVIIFYFILFYLLLNVNIIIYFYLKIENTRKINDSSSCLCP